MSKFSRRSLLKTTISGATAISVSALASPLAASLANVQEVTRKGRIKQSASRWCYKDIPLDEFCKRGAEMGLSVLLAKLVAGADQILASQLAGEMRTWRGVKVGVVEPAPSLKAAVRALPRQSAAAVPR